MPLLLRNARASLPPGPGWGARGERSRADPGSGSTGGCLGSNSRPPLRSPSRLRAVLFLQAGGQLRPPFPPAGIGGCALRSRPARGLCGARPFPSGFLFSSCRWTSGSRPPAPKEVEPGSGRTDVCHAGKGHSQGPAESYISRGSWWRGRRLSSPQEGRVLDSRGWDPGSQQPKKAPKGRGGGFAGSPEWPRESLGGICPASLGGQPGAQTWKGRVMVYENLNADVASAAKRKRKRGGAALCTAHLFGSQVNELPCIWVQMSGSTVNNNMVVGVTYHLSSQG